MLMKKGHIALAVILLLVASVTAILSVRSHNSMDDFFKANVEALTMDEGTPVNTCYIDSDDFADDYTTAVFCDSRTSSTMIYPCLDRRWGRKGVNSSVCTK